ATSLTLLRESALAYRAGRTRDAQDLATSSYLDGFELTEASLDALDRRLRLAVEAEMLADRALLRAGAPAAGVRAKAGGIEGMLVEARALLEVGGLPASATFVSAFTILLREGLEALLVVAAMYALLVRAGRFDALRYVHAGWIAALAAGGLTWVGASYAISNPRAFPRVAAGRAAARR